MKTFKSIFSEVAQPKSPEERAFKDQHKVELIDYPSPDSEQIFKGTIKKAPKRFSDYMAGEDEKAYDQAYTESVITEKATSKAQQRLMGMAYALKTGEMEPEDASDEVKELAKNMSKKDLEDFAKTKHKGLPDKAMDESVETLFEDPMEEVRMMMSQLNFICYAAEEIAEFLEESPMYDPEEWYQNKLANTHSMMKTLYSYMRGQKRNYYADLERSYYGEEKEDLSEAMKVKAGTMTLNDGSKVKVSKQDAQLLNQMLADMNTRNRKDFEKILMTDQAGFNEIVGFAREAL